MKNWLRYGWRRRYVVRLVSCIWKKGNTPEWVLNFLYPDDCTVTFK